MRPPPAAPPPAAPLPRPLARARAAEYCDMGTLRDAVKRGLFHVPISKDVVAVDLLKVIKVGDHS